MISTQCVCGVCGRAGSQNMHQECASPPTFIHHRVYTTLLVCTCTYMYIRTCTLYIRRYNVYTYVAESLHTLLVLYTILVLYLHVHVCHVCMYVHVHVHVHCMCIHYTCTHVQYVHLHLIHVHVHVHMYVHVHVCLYKVYNC